ncbi:DUF3696 domain-containing protein [Pseudoalteromonas mariniglutinosa]|uniref:DUF3696 domain-containing protein n=1 Tax=Pseudoalteromonas mariniglutinosa TaxID=206042 RepID=UPI00385106EE
MINEIHLVNFKSFRKISIKLSNLNILTGINGTGKSTIIQSVLMVIQSGSPDFVECNGELIELGDYSDIQHENAQDDSLLVEITGFGEKSSWGFNENIGVSPSVDQLPAIKIDQSMLNFLKSNSVYISAERWGPRPNVPLNSYNSNPYWLGKHGEFTVQFLHRLSQGGFKDTNDSLISKLPDGDPRNYDDSVGPLILSNIIAWMGEISPNVKINASVIKDAMIGYSSFSFGNGKQHKATNVGFGISYSLSIVTALVAAKKGSIVIIENPEAHIHPSGQSRLGQLIALTAKAGVQVLIETHSEHVINGSRIMIRKDLVPSDELNVMYVDRLDGQDESMIRCIKANKMGQLSEWPDGFFDQQAKDMKTLMTGV